MPHRACVRRFGPRRDFAINATTRDVTFPAMFIEGERPAIGIGLAVREE